MDVVMPSCDCITVLNYGQRLANDCSDFHPWIERRNRILKNHLHSAAQRTEIRATRPEPILITKADLTGVWLDEPQQHSRQGGFPTT